MYQLPVLRHAILELVGRYRFFIPSLMLTASFLVFGVDLESLLERDAPNGQTLPGALPTVFARLVQEVESRGLTEIGICMFT